MKFIVANGRKMTISHIYSPCMYEWANTPKMLHSGRLFCCRFCCCSLSFLLTNVQFFSAFAVALLMLPFRCRCCLPYERCAVICAFFCFQNIIHFNLMLSTFGRGSFLRVSVWYHGILVVADVRPILTANIMILPTWCVLARALAQFSYVLCI